MVTVVEGLAYPWSIAWLPSGEMLVTERPGRLRIVRDGVLVPEPVAGLPEVYRNRGQGGFMDVLPHPDFASNWLIYLSYGKPNTDASEGTTTVVRGRLEGNRVVTLLGTRAVSEERLLTGVLGRVRDVRQGPDGFIYLTIEDSDGEPTTIVRLEPVAGDVESPR